MPDKIIIAAEPGSNEEKHLSAYLTFACDNCGKRFEWKAGTDVKEGRKVLAFLGWHYVTADKSQDGRCWELCPSQVCTKCKNKKLKKCEHSCQAKWATVMPTGTQTAPDLPHSTNEELI